MNYDTLKALGVRSLEDIESYKVRSEGDNDVLKIYHKKERGALFHRSEKFKFHRTKRAVRKGDGSNDYSEISEVSPMLTKVMSELDEITRRDRTDKDIKEKILLDLRHLEKVVNQKISEIQADLDKL